MNHDERLVGHLLPLVENVINSDSFPITLFSQENLPALLAHTAATAKAVSRLRTDYWRRRVGRSNQVALGRKLLLGRRGALLRDLRPFWIANGTLEYAIEDAAGAVDRVQKAWPGQVYDLHQAGAAEDFPFNSAYAEFIGALADIEQRDRCGPLGRAVTASRYAGADYRTMDKPYLSGESQRPIGFPVLLGRDGSQRPEHVITAAWVEPVAKWPEWLSGSGVSKLTGGAEQANRLAKARRLWRELTESVAQALKQAKYEAQPPPNVLPEWYLLYIAHWDVDGLDSAGLALALQALAAKEGWPIPAGVGFTGQWKEGRLAPVSGIARKLQAAREAGIFALFACTEETLAKKEVEGGGVDLILLPEGRDLAEIVPLINTACAARGLTEDRWQWQSKKLAASLGTHGRIASLPLPEAANPEANPENLPFGLLDRKQLKDDMRAWKQSTERPNRPRQIRALIGKARSGKTTLLSHWLINDKDAWPRFPAWFSFLRNTYGADRTRDLQEALEIQLRARYAVVLPPQDSDQPGQRKAEDLSESEKRIQRICRYTSAPIDIVVDGLDEAYHGDEPDILQTLTRLLDRATVATVLIGTQPGSQAVESIDSSLKFDLDRRPNRLQEDAEQLIKNAAQVFKKSEDRCLRKIGNTLDNPDWQKRLAKRADWNLWKLTDFLRSHLENPDAGPWPNSPEEIPLTGDVRQYCRTVFEATLDSYEPASERDEAAVFATYVAILENQWWSIDDVLYFSGRTLSPADRARWERLLTGRMRRFLSFDKQHVRFRDGTFQDYLSETHPLDRQTVTKQLVDLLKSGSTDAIGRPALREYAVSSAARHVLRENEPDANLAAELVLQTEWIPARLQFLAAQKKPVNDILGYLGELRPFVESVPLNATSSVDSVSRVLATWGWAIDQSQGQVIAWWENLADLRSDPVWANLHPAFNKPSGPVLLLPSRHGDAGGPGYTSLRTTFEPFAGPACELPCPLQSRQSTLVLATRSGNLLTYSYDWNTGVISPTAVHPVGLNPICQLAATGDAEVTLLGNDQIGQHSLMRVDVRSGARTPLPTGGKILAFQPVESGRADLLVALEGESLSDGTPTTKLGLVINNEVKEVSYGPIPFRPHHFQVFAPGTWIMAEVGYGSAKDALAIVRLGDELEDRTEPEFRADLGGKYITGACALPGNRLAIVAVSYRHPRSVDVIVISADGHLEQPIDLHTAGTNPQVDPLPPRRRYRYSMHGTIPPQFSARVPLGWHDKLGLLLGDHTGLTGSLNLQNDVGFEEFPSEKRLVPCDDVSFEQALSLQNGGTLFVYSTEAHVLAPDGSTFQYIESRGRLKLWGCIQDGSAVIERPIRYMSPPPKCDLSVVYNGDRPLKLTFDGTTLYRPWFVEANSGKDFGIYAIKDASAKTDEPICTVTRMRELLKVGQGRELQLLDAIQDVDRGWFIAVTVVDQKPTPDQDDAGDSRKAIGRSRPQWGGLRRNCALSIVWLTGDQARVVYERACLNQGADVRLNSCAGGLLCFSVLEPNDQCSIKLIEFDSGCVHRGADSQDSSKPLPRRHWRDRVRSASKTESDHCLVRIAANCAVIARKASRPSVHGHSVDLLLHHSGAGKEERELLEETETVTAFHVLELSSDAVRLGWIRPLGKGAQLRFYEFRRGKTDDHWQPARQFSINLGQENATCCAIINLDRIAVGYETKRIEVISVGQSRQKGEKAVVAVGFTLTPPTDIVLSRSTHGTYLVVAADDFLWFELPS